MPFRSWGAQSQQVEVILLPTACPVVFGKRPHRAPEGCIVKSLSFRWLKAVQHFVKKNVPNVVLRHSDIIEHRMDAYDSRASIEAAQATRSNSLLARSPAPGKSCVHLAAEALTVQPVKHRAKIMHTADRSEQSGRRAGPIHPGSTMDEITDESGHPVFRIHEQVAQRIQHRRRRM